MYKKISAELELLKNPGKAKILSRFFKTGKGEYGEGDKFLGITVPQEREIAKKHYQDSTFDDIKELIKSEYHEIRMTGFLILGYQQEFFLKKKNFNEQKQKEISDFYLSHLEFANNWDLVDLSCGPILGDYLIDKDKSILYKLACDKNMRKQRVAIVTSLSFVRKGNFDDAIRISEILLNHSHDLLHKAVGWILREIGKKDERVLTDFLNTHINEMSRTTLRYAIEKFPPENKKLYMNK